MTITNEQRRLANDFKVTPTESATRFKAEIEGAPILISETFYDRYITGRHLPSKMDSMPIAFRRKFSSDSVMLHEGDIAYMEDYGDVYRIEGLYRDPDTPVRPRMPKHYKDETLWQFQVTMKLSIEGCHTIAASFALCHVLASIIGMCRAICATNAPADVLKTSFNQAMDAIYPVIARDLGAHDRMRSHCEFFHGWEMRTDKEYAKHMSQSLSDQLTGCEEIPDEMIDILLRAHGVINMIRVNYCEQFMLDEFKAYAGFKIDQMRGT
ncbi:hypothetical protein [uncultured Sulfitobacter sp.]|uniref:hypothetical protein n=1 Tax=uncultured Sulfitobacter sp. TaxID=191468 RepID=UPI0030D6FA31